jgi:predicted small lipoprotein YifL
MRTLFVPLALIVLLSACGFKGPLYLPAAKVPASQQKQQASQPVASPVKHQQEVSQP